MPCLPPPAGFKLIGALSELPRTLSVLDDIFFGTSKVHDVSSTLIVAHF